MKLSDYMRFCLRAYYTTHTHPIGKDGDFITAPEISQVFGEMIGLWCVLQWEKLGCPQSLALLELGPGRGLLMRDVVRILSKHPKLLGALEIHLLEINPSLQELQKTNIPHQVHHYLTLSDALKGCDHKPILILANEFLDALPIDQYSFKDQKWYQRHVHCEEGVYSPVDVPYKGTPPSALEVCPEAEALLDAILQHLKRTPGGCLFVDYGYTQGGGYTLQALSKHQHVSPYENPGQHDITAHVNFGRLKSLVSEEFAVTLSTQQEFLISMGILVRTEQLMQGKTAEEQTKIWLATQRLIDPAHMGELFKVLEVLSFPDGVTASRDP